MALFSLALMCPARSSRRAPSQRRLALPACLCHHHASTPLRVYGAAGKLRSGQQLQRGVLQCVPRGAHVRVGEGGGTADVRQRGAPLWAPSCENDGAVESVGGAGAPRGASCRHCRAVPRVPSDVDWSSSVSRRRTSGAGSHICYAVVSPHLSSRPTARRAWRGVRAHWNQSFFAHGAPCIL